MTPPQRPRIRSYRDLIVWQRSMKLARETYRLTARFPRREIYGIVSQMRRASVSVAANIAEGHGRQSTRDYLRFLAMANGSLRELETYYELSQSLAYLAGADVTVLQAGLLETGRMLTRLRQALSRKAGR